MTLKIAKKLIFDGNEVEIYCFIAKTPEAPFGGILNLKKPPKGAWWDFSTNQFPPHSLPKVGFFRFFSILTTTLRFNQKNSLHIRIYIYIYICNELIEETARHRKLIFGMWESFGYGSSKF